MITIGVPKELKPFENRVGLIPFYVKKLVEQGNKVLVQKDAGLNADIYDQEYIDAGASIISDIKDIYNEANLIIKVKEPQKEEYSLIREKQIIFTFFHFASNFDLLKHIINSRCIAIAYETLQVEDNKLPILSQMSAIAGKLSVQIGMHYLENTNGGKGILLGGMPKIHPGNVLILGGGTVGINACYVASRLRANITLLDLDLNRLRTIHELMPVKNIKLLYSNKENIINSIKTTDLVISGIHTVGEKPPILITRDMLKLMDKKSVLVDVSIDQGGAFETSRPTDHDNPIYIENGVIHYCVTNMPSIVAKTSTYVLSYASFPFIQQIALKNIKLAIENNPYIKTGLNTIYGEVVNKNIANNFNIDWIEPDKILNNMKIPNN